MNNNILKLKEYAKENHVPIILDDGLSFLMAKIKEFNVETILEVGTAIGYSAINMASNDCVKNVITLERDLDMITLAKENIAKFSLDDKITIIEGDAKVANLAQYQFDLIFIDAAKGSYQVFFDRFTPLLKVGGIVICDNMDFHDLVLDPDKLANASRSLRAMIRKLNTFKDNLLANENYVTTYHHIGDGLTCSIKIK